MPYFNAILPYFLVRSFAELVGVVNAVGPDVPQRLLFGDPLRTAILLLGGNKTGDGRWYEKFVPIADRLYDEHLERLRKKGTP